jgi:hypothetical protein
MTYVRPWDYGLVVRTDVVSVDEDFLVLDPTFVAERVIRALTKGLEDELIAGYIRAATEIAEDHAHIEIVPKRLKQSMSGLPSGRIELRRSPVRSIYAFEYYDGDSALQAYGGSPPTYIFNAGSAQQKATLETGIGEMWPTTVERSDAVVITYDVGYLTAASVPQKFKTGIAALAGELYKNPDLSNDQGQAANLINLDNFFPRHY